jgi:hypothetical protein
MPLTTSPPADLREQIEALTSTDESERRAAIDRWRPWSAAADFAAVADGLLGVVRRGEAKAAFASESLVAFGDPVLTRILRHLAHADNSRVRVRLLELLTQMPPATDPFRALAFETSLLALAHAERDEAVQRAFAPALFRHAPSARYAALRAAEERMQPGAEVSSTPDEPELSDSE